MAADYNQLFANFQISNPSLVIDKFQPAKRLDIFIRNQEYKSKMTFGLNKVIS